MKTLSQNKGKPTGLFIAVACITAVYSILSAVLMTEPGQSLNLPRGWIVAYYANRWVLIGLNVALLVAFWYLHAKVRLWRNVWAYLASVGVVFCIVAATSINVPSRVRSNRVTMSCCGSYAMTSFCPPSSN